MSFLRRSSVEPFCNTVTDPSKPLQLGCTSDRDAVGYCTLVKLDPPPPADYQVTILSQFIYLTMPIVQSLQYFPSLGPSYGGNVVVADYCPFYQVRFDQLKKKTITTVKSKKNFLKGLYLS